MNIKIKVHWYQPFQSVFFAIRAFACRMQPTSQLQFSVNFMRLKQSVSTLPYLIDQFLERQGLNGGEKSGYNGGIFPVANTFSTFKALLELINCSLSMFWSLVIQVNTYHKIRNSVAYVYTNLRQNLRLNRKTVIAMMGTPQIKKRKICFR